MPTYCDPKDLDEAESRRMAISRKMVGLQAALTDINSEMQTRGRVPVPEYARLTQERKRICAEKDAAQVEMQKIKAWIKQHSKNIARTIYADSEDVEKLPSLLVHNAHAVRSLVQSLRTRIEELLSENESLHNRLQELELENTNKFPDNRREGWRQDSNLDNHNLDKP